MQRSDRPFEADIVINLDFRFFYDFAIPDHQLKPDDLKTIRKEMDKIIKKNIPIVKEEISYENAQQEISNRQETYKLELLRSIRSPPITMYRIGGWSDLCAGPHVGATGELQGAAIELESIAGVYWRGDERNVPMLQRVYGVVWESQEQMSHYRAIKAEAMRRDHRGVGKKLDLFSLQEDAGGGLVFWHPKGSRVRKIIEDYWREIHMAV